MVTAGDQDGLLVTASGSLQNCYADWSGLLGNTTTNNKIFDITGNLREITKSATAGSYNLMGGADDSAEAGSTLLVPVLRRDHDVPVLRHGLPLLL